MSGTEIEKHCVARWKAAGPALAAVRAEELRSMTAEEALEAADALLSMAEAPTGSSRWTTSGLVEQQRLFQLGRHARQPSSA
ncbi:MAG TPA: hypothetical protein VNB06_09545 [Thermoanaerobaculia bacterium]|nr:hypothetical protein [Thermoanaerobaculia bacterium]